MKDDIQELSTEKWSDGQITNVGLIQKISPNCEIHFLPAIAGGS